MRRRSQLKRGALYTANPLLPDTAGSACRLPGLPVSASKVSGGCKNEVRPLRVIDAGARKIGPRGEMEMSHGVHCASFLLCTCTTGMGASDPSCAAETSGPEPWAMVERIDFGRFSLHPFRKRQPTGFQAIFRQYFFTRRNDNFPNRIFCRTTAN